MTAPTFIERQVTQIRRGGWSVVGRKLKLALRGLLKLPSCIVAVPAVVLIRLIRPCILIRLGELPGPRIGHFAAHTEMYLCERDAGINVPGQAYVDLFSIEQPICNQQLATMWRRLLRVWPTWILAPISLVNQLIPGGTVHEIDEDPFGDRDVHNLLDRIPPHLEFTAEEEARGDAGLEMMGIPSGTAFVCLNVRDSAYLDAHQRKIGATTATAIAISKITFWQPKKLLTVGTL